MRAPSPRGLMFLGGGLLVCGWLLLFLIVVGVVAPGFALSFLAYGVSFIGFVLGLIGLLEYRGTLD